MTTLRDVAERAGVSIGSVSAVINGTAPVSASMRARVTAAIEELGYAPDGVARSLKLGRTRTIGLVIPDITNPHFAAMAKTIEAGCDAAGYTLMLSNTTDNPEKELRYLRLMRTQRVDGVILVAGGVEPGHTDAIRGALTVPVVLVDRVMQRLDYDAVLLDNRAASRMVVEYLIRVGHRRIGIVTGSPGISLSAERFEGYVETLAEHGIPFDDRLAACGHFNKDRAFLAAVELLHRRPRPTAILSTSNHTTIGVMNAIVDQGFRCPKDISVAGIDDFDWANAFEPRLTTAAQPIAELADRAVQCLLARLSGTETGAPKRIVLPPQLMVRDSCRVLE